MGISSAIPAPRLGTCLAHHFLDKLRKFRLEVVGRCTGNDLRFWFLRVVVAKQGFRRTKPSNVMGTPRPTLNALPRG